MQAMTLPWGEKRFNRKLSAGVFIALATDHDDSALGGYALS